MDVMAAHDIKVTFCLEPYRDDRGKVFAKDVRYLMREYGEKRGFDALLLLRNADGKEGPLFKGFACILPEDSTDCHGKTHPISNYTTDAQWRSQTDEVREALRGQFDHVTLLADSLHWPRTVASGFDGITVFDNYIAPDRYAGYAAAASAADLVFSFNINPGFDMIVDREVEPGSCYAPPPFAPPAEAALDWSRIDERERAARLSTARIASAFEATLRVQTDPALSNARRGFFLVYINSFNEWHEGHSFEPMKDLGQLTAEERALGYHNPSRRLVPPRHAGRAAAPGARGQRPRRARPGLAFPQEDRPVPETVQKPDDDRARSSVTETAAFNGSRRIPPPVNEPVRSYAPGSPEKAEVKARLKQMAAETVEIPLVVGGREVRTGDTATTVMPHDHAHTLARWHRARREDVERAIAAAAEAHRDWSTWSLEDRAAIFLKAAELLATTLALDPQRRHHARPVQDDLPGRDRRRLRDGRTSGGSIPSTPSSSTRSSPSPIAASGTSSSTGRWRGSSTRSRPSTSPRSAGTCPPRPPSWATPSSGSRPRPRCSPPGTPCASCRRRGCRPASSTSCPETRP